MAVDSSIDSPRRAQKPQMSKRFGHWSLGLAIVALLGGLAAVAAIGFTVPAMEAQYGRFLGSTPGGFQTIVLTLTTSMLLWTALGLLAIIFSFISFFRPERAPSAIWGLVIAVIAPILCVAALMATLVMTAANVNINFM
jgi:hypothetical protein